MGGTPKSSILIGSSLINQPFFGYPHLILGNTPRKQGGAPPVISWFIT